MIYQFDMGSCQAIGDEDTTGTTIVEPRFESHAAPRLSSVEEAIAAEPVRRPGIIAVLAYPSYFAALDCSLGVDAPASTPSPASAWQAC